MTELILLSDLLKDLHKLARWDAAAKTSVFRVGMVSVLEAIDSVREKQRLGYKYIDVRSGQFFKTGSGN